MKYFKELIQVRLINGWKFYFDNSDAINIGDLEEHKKITIRAYKCKSTQEYKIIYFGACFESKMDIHFSTENFEKFKKQVAKTVNEYGLELKKITNV